MNRLPMPEVDDAAAFVALSNNVHLKSYPHLQGSVAAIHQSYIRYTQAKGDGNAIVALALDKDTTAFLKDHYASPPGNLAFIKTLRRSSEINVCPLCGSLGSGQLDHLLPKATFPSFTVYSRNLVPACRCNGRKSTTVVGAQHGERILHPYFDACLSRRLLAARFEDHGATPRISLRLFTRDADPATPAIKFHVKNVVQKMPVLGHLAKRWTSLCRRPPVAVPALASIPASSAQLRHWLGKERDRFDCFHESKNNWESVFVTGLMERPTLEWLFARLAQPGRDPESAIEWR